MGLLIKPLSSSEILEGPNYRSSSYWPAAVVLPSHVSNDLHHVAECIETNKMLQHFAPAFPTESDSENGYQCLADIEVVIFTWTPVNSVEVNNGYQCSTTQ